jgi:UPF0716 protein FxsA
MYILLAIILLPIIEIAVFIKVGGLIGLWQTLALILLTAFGGIALLRHQGFAVAQRARESLARNEPPVAEVFDGFCLVAAGVLLLTPGFVTDIFGALLFIPAFRRFLRRRMIGVLRKRGEMRVFMDGAEVGPNGPFSRGSRPPPGVIDAEFRDVTPDESGPGAGPTTDLPPPDSRWRPPHNH